MTNGIEAYTNNMEQHEIRDSIKNEIFLEESQISEVNRWGNNTSCSAIKDGSRIEEVNMGCHENVQFSNMSNTVIIHCPKDDVQSSCVRHCTSCRKLINTESYLSWELMDFCNEACISKIQGLGSSECVYCSRFISVISFGKYYVRVGKDLRLFCTKSCLDSYNLTIKFCSCCHESIIENFSVGLRQLDSNKLSFCSQNCCDTFNSVLKNNPLMGVPLDTKCSVCQRDKPVTIVLKHDGTINYFCSKRCLIAFSFVKLQAGAEKCAVCQNYFSRDALDNTLFYENVQLTFCSNSCQNIYILLYSKIVYCSFCQNKRYNFGMIRKYSKNCLPTNNLYLCSVNCIRLYQMSSINEMAQDNTVQDANTQSESVAMPPSVLAISQTSDGTRPNIDNHTTALLSNSHLIRPSLNTSDTTKNSKFYLPIQTRQQFLVQSAPKMEQRNVATMCFIPKAEKSTLARPIMLKKATQTVIPDLKEILLPVPFPIYIPVPMAMYSFAVPVAVPFPIPIPVPIFIPTVRTSMEGIAREIEKMQNKIPSDPYEAELLQIADVIAEEKTREDNSAISDEGATLDMNGSNIILGETLKETETTADAEDTCLDMWELNNVNVCEFRKEDSFVQDCNILGLGGKKRYSNDLFEDAPKRDRKLAPNEITKTKTHWGEKTKLNYTLGINAWKQWVKEKCYFFKNTKKNAINKVFKTDILQMRPDELNYALCLFIKELKKPKESDYAPDTLFYLCLGIQYYLNQNGRNDNIFQDAIYNTFTDKLDELAQKFCALYDDDSHFIVTRVEEEHLWEAKQLGCHSPLVLLNTLIYFNTKYYLSSTVEQHMDISFFQVLKVWKKKAKSKSLMLRFCPKKPKNNAKRVCEQYENESNHSRCPVRLYEFYLSKCPESTKTRHDLFYLQPEKYCIPDSPLWYTASPIPKEALAKMINRVKIVKEINVALLSND